MSGTIERAAETILARWHGPESGSKPLPAELRPRSLPEAYGIQQAVSRELGPVGGWRICRAEPEVRLAAAPLPIAMFQPEPALLAVADHETLRALPALALELGRSLPEYDTPFSESEVVGAIGSTRPAVLVLDPSCNEDRHDDPLAAIAEFCGRASVIYGRAAVAGLPQARNITLTIGRRRSDTETRAVAIGDLIGPLQWLANFGTGFSGGLMVTQGGLTVRQMVVLPLRTDAIPIAPGVAVEIRFGDLGKVALHTAGAKP
ncbi:MAG: hypothetical protein ACREFJ_06760 [Acetobacteraceae bacterium]